MSSVAVSIEDLGKRYRLGQFVGPRNHTSFREVLAGLGSRAVRRLRRGASADRPGPEEFWALRDVNFEVPEGEVVGIVGRNGAGKSTLLKVLSRITEPTEGRVTIHGRTASLLEVGTGFHPELTGRENVYLNGAILGMTRSEVRSRFDEIVAFAEVEKFLDTPVKRYSSGMYVRLAFAVAAHLEPEILIVDEVLAVGDQEFQAKCLGKMNQVRRSGRTVLFVSHNIAAVRALCSTAVMLDKGRAIESGPAGAVLDSYIARQKTGGTVLELQPPRTDQPYIERIQVLTPTIRYGDVVEIELHVVSPVTMAVGLDIKLHDEGGSAIAYLSTYMVPGQIELEGGRSTVVRVAAGPLNLATGGYDLYICLMKPFVEELHDVGLPVRFEVLHADPGGTGFEFLQ